MTFIGKTVIVTGGSRGIGRAIVTAFETAGAVVRDVSRASGKDLRNRATRASVDTTCDILVNCAGAMYSAAALDYPLAEWDAMLELNLTAAFDLSRRAAKTMKPGGRIVNISSIAGIQGTRGIIGYSVAKAGMIEMTKCLSNELAPRGITVNAIAPGYIDTDMLTLRDDKLHAATVLGRIPAGRWGAPGDVAAAVLFLCSDEASYITGITLPVDGGWLAR
jgi:2-deoxy-D-gluconate 3-dehydrogenase